MPFVETVILSMWGVVLRHSPGICDGSIVPLSERSYTAMEANWLSFNGHFGVNTDETVGS